MHLFSPMSLTPFVAPFARAPLAAALVCVVGAFGLTAHAAPITVNAGGAFTLNNGSVQVNQVFNSGAQKLEVGSGDYSVTGNTYDMGGGLAWQMFSGQALPL